MQAVQLGFSPRIRIDHTSRQQYGQIYIGSVNWALLLGCVVLVLVFRTSSNLAAAYGVAVTSTMAITTILLYVVARDRWRWSRTKAGIIASLFLVVDLAFLGANIIKVADGGWLPLLLAAAIYTGMTTWKSGRRILAQHIQSAGKPLKDFINQLPKSTTRVPGTAVFMNGSASKTPPALRHNLEHNKVLHECVIFLTVKTQLVPSVPQKRRLEVEDLGNGLYAAKVNYGFMEKPNIPRVLQEATKHGIRCIDPKQVTYFLGRETIIATGRPGMAVWRERLFALMARNATTATFYFGIPADRVVELGEQVEI
jgi:KUP system potassium uptake protein